MALQRTRTLLLCFVVTLLGLELVQPCCGQGTMYQRFLRQHVDIQMTAGNDNYCNVMMQRRKMTSSSHCKPFNTFIHEDIWSIRNICGTFLVVMALQRTRSMLLLLQLTLLGLELVQPCCGQPMYERFRRQHVDTEVTAGNDNYCNVMMQRRSMTSSNHCKPSNTFIHEDIARIGNICRTANVQCSNGQMNCHEGVVRVTDCRETGGSRAPNCRYRAAARTRRVVIACEGNPEVPVHFDR